MTASGSREHDRTASLAATSPPVASRSPRWTRLSALVLAAAFLALHSASLPRSLEDLDSINFAAGIRKFDVARHGPHPPGSPLFVALAKLSARLVGPEHLALGALAILSGTLGVLAALAFFRGLDPARRGEAWPVAATVLTIACPLYWFNASRPMSDATGLAAALAVQAVTLRARTGAGVALASGLAAFATGLRTQVGWLTLPLALFALARLSRGERRGAAVKSALALLVGGLLWGIPLVALNGGARAYLRALATQGGGDLGDELILWASPTPGQLALSLEYAFVTPWLVPWLAVPVLALALLGLLRLARTSRPALLALGAAFGPYLVLDLLFQQAVTSRYALPLVPPVAFLAVHGIPRARGLLVLLPIAVAGPALAWSSGLEAPAFRMLEDMRVRRLQQGAAATAPVFATHQRPGLDLSRPLEWMGDDCPTWSALLRSPTAHEWLEVVFHFARGERTPVWFVAEPRRTDLAVFDPWSRELAGSYRWPLRPVSRPLVSGSRPDEMDWIVIDRPGWMLGRGWALTPEVAGVSAADGRGPAEAPVAAMIRRRPDAVTLLVGGRRLDAGDGAPVTVSLALDSRVIVLDQLTFTDTFLRIVNLPPGALLGDGPYAFLRVAARGSAPPASDHVSVRPPVRVALDQFDAQPVDRVVLGLAAGWHQAEQDPASGTVWRWTDGRATMRVSAAAGRPLVLTVAGETPPSSFPRRAASVPLVIRAGGRVLFDDAVAGEFRREVRIPAGLTDAGGHQGEEEIEVAIESGSFVPAERDRGSPDTRRLGLRITECRIEPEGAKRE